MSSTNTQGSSAIQQIATDVQSVKQALDANRLFDILDFVREEVARLSRQNAELQNDISALHREVLASQANAPAD